MAGSKNSLIVRGNSNLAVGLIASFFLMAPASFILGAEWGALKAGSCSMARRRLHLKLQQIRT